MGRRLSRFESCHPDFLLDRFLRVVHFIGSFNLVRFTVGLLINKILEIDINQDGNVLRLPMDQARELRDAIEDELLLAPRGSVLYRKRKSSSIPRIRRTTAEVAAGLTPAEAVCQRMGLRAEARSHKRRSTTA